MMNCVKALLHQGAVLMIVLSSISQLYAAPHYSKEEVAETLKTCCFPDESKNLMLFKEPVSVWFYDAIGLYDNQIDLFSIPIDFIKLRTGIDLNFEDLKTSAYEQSESEIFIIVLPAEQSNIQTKDFENIEHIYNRLLQSTNVEVNDSNRFKNVLDKFYHQNIFERFFSRSNLMRISSRTKDAQSSMLFIKIPNDGLLVQRTLATVVLAGLGYNPELKELKHSIFSKFEGSNEFHEADVASFSELDFLVLRILWDLYTNVTHQQNLFREV